MPNAGSSGASRVRTFGSWSSERTASSAAVTSAAVWCPGELMSLDIYAAREEICRTLQLLRVTIEQPGPDGVSCTSLCRAAKVVVSRSSVSMPATFYDPEDGVNRPPNCRASLSEDRGVAEAGRTRQRRDRRRSSRWLQRGDRSSGRIRRADILGER
jgi:hypothetical protein